MTVRTQQQAVEKRRQERRAGDRRSRSDRRTGRRKSSGPGIGTLFVMCLLGLLALGVFISFNTEVGVEIDWRKMFFTKDQEASSFKMGGVSLGMSADSVKRMHSNIDLKEVASGESIGSFSFEGANYTLWFVNIDGKEKAFRMRYDQAFASRSETEILDRLGDKHGKPGTSECSKAGEDARKCHFQWWPSGGIALTVTTTEKTLPNAKQKTLVTMIATDTYLDGKRMRLRKARAAPAAGKKTPEKLPF